LKPILIMKTGSTLPTLREAGEDFEDWIITGLDVPAHSIRVVAVHQLETLPSLADIAGIVITGSPAMVTDFEPWTRIAADYLRVAVQKRLPVLGICYGHQLLAQACGGHVGYHPRGREIGTVDIHLTALAGDDPLLQGMPETFCGHTTHSQTVLTLPPHAQLLAASAHDPHQCFRLGEQAWGVQFHPEFTARVMRRYILERWDELEQEGLNADGILQQVREAPEASALLTRFARLSGV
jgi:GMP synthase (glutamine-hydrolysing)